MNNRTDKWETNEGCPVCGDTLNVSVGPGAHAEHTTRGRPVEIPDESGGELDQATFIYCARAECAYIGISGSLSGRKWRRASTTGYAAKPGRGRRNSTSVAVKTQTNDLFGFVVLEHLGDQVLHRTGVDFVLPQQKPKGVNAEFVAFLEIATDVAPGDFLRFHVERRHESEQKAESALSRGEIPAGCTTARRRRR